MRVRMFAALAIGLASLLLAATPAWAVTRADVDTALAKYQADQNDTTLAQQADFMTILQGDISTALTLAQSLLAADTAAGDSQAVINDNLLVSYIQSLVPVTYPIWTGIPTYTTDITAPCADPDISLYGEQYAGRCAAVTTTVAPLPTQISSVNTSDVSSAVNAATTAVTAEGDAAQQELANQQAQMTAYNDAVQSGSAGYQDAVQKYYGDDQTAVDTATTNYIDSGSQSRLASCTGATVDTCGSTYYSRDDSGYSETLFNNDVAARDAYNAAIAQQAADKQIMDDYMAIVNSPPTF